MAEKKSPERKARQKPVELLVLSAVIGVFIFAVIVMGSRNIILGLEFGGVGFIVSLVVLAMLALAVRPKGDEIADLKEQNEQNGSYPRPEDRPHGH